MAEAAVRCLRDGRLDGEHAPALAVEGSLQCCPLAAGAMLHVAAALASQIAAGKAQARGLVILAFDRSPEVYLDFMRRRGLDSNALDRCVRILDCYSDPLGWKQKIHNQQRQENSRTQTTTNKENITVFRNVKDVEKLMYSTTELGGGFEGEGKTYFSIAVDSISSMLRHASVPSISGLLSNFRSHDQVSSIFWLMHSDLHEPKVPRAFQCLSTMIASVEPALVDPVYGESPGNMSFLEQNYSKAKIIVRLKRRNGRVKHLYEDLHVEGNDVKFVSAPSVSTEVNQSLVPKVQFNLELSEKERSDRANVVLPFEHQGKGATIRIYDGRRSLAEAQGDPNLTAPALVNEIKAPEPGTAKGEIHYIRDSDDEHPDSDEDPDDDLDI
ncbi:elongator complex protein 5 [Phragmites australis]|uniref:elongator complex protein 5 n=1 Tax=Phragmites australis TaxID=29695 RepID=UPI002D7712B9|nr:elongator complex protein 5 [Phragmites australis]